MIPLSRSPRITKRDKLYDGNHEYSMTLWHKLAVCPDKKFAIPMMMDKNNIIVPVHDALLKYNISQNKWIEFYKYPQEIRFNFGAKRIQILHFNSKANCLYILAANHIESIPDFIQINIKTNQYQKLSKFCKSRPLHNNCVEIGDNLHLFVQNRFNFQLKHCLFNKKLNNHTEIQKFNEFSNYQGIVHLKSKKMILLFTINEIRSYSLREHKWNQLNIEFPKELKDELTNTRIDQFGYILCRNEQFLILFTGFIWIIDLVLLKVRKSKIVCPLKKGYFHAVVNSEDIYDEIICNGYIRKYWNRDNQGTLRILPMYLIKLIQSYFSDQIIHLFETYSKIGHWKIKMNDILLNVL